MHKKEYPILCGGTFFTLLLEAAKPGLKCRRRGHGSKGEFTEMDVFEALLKIVVPTYERPDDDSFKSVVSAYKSCSFKKSGRLYLHQQPNLAYFDDRVCLDHHTLVVMMEGLVERFVDVEGKGIWLTKAILELIKLDSSIPESAAFVMPRIRFFVSKEDLITSSRVHLPALLLSVWHYIIVNKIDNSTGRQTYDEWCRPGRSPNTREPFQSDIGSGITQRITLVLSDYTDMLVNIDYTEPERDKPEWDEPGFNTYEENEPHESHVHSDNTPPYHAHTQNNVVVQQFGYNSKFIGNIGTLIINND